MSVPDIVLPSFILKLVSDGGPAPSLVSVPWPELIPVSFIALEHSSVSLSGTAPYPESVSSSDPASASLPALPKRQYLSEYS